MKHNGPDPATKLGATSSTTRPTVHVERVCAYVRLEANGEAADGDETTVAVVLAAHSVGRAGVAASNTDDVDGGAVQADGDVQVREDDTKQTEDRTRACRVGSRDGVAALDGAGAARRSGLTASDLEGGGGRKNGQSSESEDGDAGEHDCSCEESVD